MNWITLKALNDIYIYGRTPKKATLQGDPTIQFLITGTGELKQSTKEIIAGHDFQAYYEQNHLANYQAYKAFLEQKQLLKPQTRFEEGDIRILMEIDERMQSGELVEIRDQMIEVQESVRGVSLMFYRHEKYLEGKPSLVDATKQLLGIDELAEDFGQQYKYVLECRNPKCIVLCENLNFLKRPARPRAHDIELWYAGGRNVPKLELSDTRGLPIYYSCDWDHDGLDIFRLVKSIIPSIQLLFPTGQPKSINATDHKSLWEFKDKPDQLSGLNTELFTDTQAELIQNLIKTDSWIIEESNDLIKMLAQSFKRAAPLFHQYN
jgi:hypothetical protein